MRISSRCKLVQPNHIKMIILVYNQKKNPHRQTNSKIQSVTVETEVKPIPVRDRPFNLQGRAMGIFSVQKIRVLEYFFWKNSESDYIFFPPPKSEYFFSNIGNQNIVFRKNHSPPPHPLEVKWTVPNSHTPDCFLSWLGTVLSVKSGDGGYEILRLCKYTCKKLNLWYDKNNHIFLRLIMTISYYPFPSFVETFDV